MIIKASRIILDKKADSVIKTTVGLLRARIGFFREHLDNLLTIIDIRRK